VGTTGHPATPVMEVPRDRSAGWRMGRPTATTAPCLSRDRDAQDATAALGRHAIVRRDPAVAVQPDLVLRESAPAVRASRVSRVSRRKR
jgi:hypothetical protein